jgi:diguanylate cyclase (GGDEF)-like protein
MAIATTPKPKRPRQPPAATSRDAGAPSRPDRADALRRIAANVSGRRDVAGLFEDIIDEAFALFGVDRAGLWLYEATAERPLRVAAQRGLSDDIVAAISDLPADAPTAGMEALKLGQVRVLDKAMRRTTPRLRAIYRGIGVRTICFVPLRFGDEPLGLLVLYHREDYDWSGDEGALARAFGDHMATAIGSARLAQASRGLADRLASIAELAGRLSRLHDVEEIAWAIVAETGRLIDRDTIRVYRVDHATGWCEPLAFEGTFLGTTSPTSEQLRLPIGHGLTGWVAANDRTIRTGDAAADPRGMVVGTVDQPESMLVVPMSIEETVHGVIVVSALGRDRFDHDDELTLTIFASYAAQAMVNADNMGRLHRQQAELEHQLDGQRRLLEVNERLLATLDPVGVLDLIADSLKAIVPYDSLTVYRVDAAAGTRRAVLARDLYADEILADEPSISGGLTGWAIDHGAAVLSNEAHLDPRSVQVPGTPFEPEAMIVVPLIIGGEVIGTLNVGRLGGQEAHYSENEFELTKLFAGQASIALQNAQAHGEVQVRAEQDALTGLRNHGAFQRQLGEAVHGGLEAPPFALVMLDLDAFKTFNDTMGHPAGDALLAAVARAMSGAVRDGDRLYRYGGDEFAAILPGADRLAAHEIAGRITRAVRERSGTFGGPPVGASAGVACFPADGVAKDELVAVADQALYQVKPDDHLRSGGAVADPYLRALDATAMTLLDRRDQDALLATIVERATALLGTPHGYLYLLEPDGRAFVARYGTGVFADLVGYLMPIEDGLAGEVHRTGRPVAVADYDRWPGRAADMPYGAFGSVMGVPLTSGSDVIGVIGIASGTTERSFGPREIDAMTRFAQLASIALENARLSDAVQRGALYDPTTGLPNRELLQDRVARALASARADHSSLAVILLDLDRFVVINETLGHAVGDRLLASVAQRLSRMVRLGDTVARFSGAEFAILLDPVADAEEARQIAERIGTELRAPFPINGRDWFIGASIGIAMATPGTGRTTPDELLREAEVAMVRAKGDSANRLTLFEPSMSAQTLERIDLENDLRVALERAELRVHYQPIVALGDEAIVGFEALIRWQHPARGLVPPVAFIPLAEETGLIIPIGRWVLETACQEAARWLASEPGGPRSTFVSVNLSARQFETNGLVEDVARILEETGLPATALELEITESVVMDQSEAGIRTLRRLRELGVRLVLDDFGTGYSSLSYLKHLPLDTIKIDRTFVAGLDAVADRSIVDAVIALAHGLGIGVVAEGIETDRQADQLRELGCDLGQGYLFARPMPADAARRLLRAARRAPRVLAG